MKSFNLVGVVDRETFEAADALISSEKAIRDILNKRAVRLNKGELSSVCALISYAAFNQNTSESFVSEILVTRFGVDEVSSLSRRAYLAVIRFLVDLDISLVRH